MKNLILLVFTFCLLSCGGTKTVRDSKKVIKGDWTLTSIDYSATGVLSMTLFNDASKACFQGSTWNFIPNNNTGTYNITNSECSTGERYFVFTIDEVDKMTGLYDFLLKPTNKKSKSETNQGFRLKLNSLSDTHMQWQQTVSAGNAPFNIIMNFTKQ